mgnify:CR=1 FL=1
MYGANGIIGKYHSYNHEHPEIAITCRGATCGIVNLTNPQCWITGNAMVCKPHNDAKVLKMYLYNFLRFSDVSSVITGSAQPQITRTNISDFQIPLPPLEVQQEIVDELEGYQKIVDGCRQVVENYKPTIDIDPSWEMVEVREVIKLSSGQGLTQKDFVIGDYDVFGGNGVTGKHNEYFIEDSTIVIGKKCIFENVSK